MLNYDECKAIAMERAERNHVEISKAYAIGTDFVFDTDEEIEGAFPLAVYADSGVSIPLWHYLNTNNKSMDDMKEIEL